MGCQMTDVAAGDATDIAAHLDGFEGTHLIGWAYRRTGAGHCAISVTDANGGLLAEGEASKERADLGALGLGRSDFAFRVPIAALGETDAVHVLADGVELWGSPLPVGQGHFDGHVYVHEGFAVGWVTERLAEFSPPMIDIVSGGKIVARAASWFEGGEPGFSPARFRIPLTPLFGAGECEIAANANGVVFARTGCNLRLVGNLDAVTPEHCAGWVFSPDAPAAALAVEVRRDGELVASAACNVVRHDVRAAHPGSNAFGFDVQLPRFGLSREQPCEISLRLADSGKELFGGPLIVGTRASVIATTRRLVQTVHDSTTGLSPAERSFLQVALADYIASIRRGANAYFTPRFAQQARASIPRMTIVVPVYRGVEVSRNCIESVLAHRNAETDFIVILNDDSPETGMKEMLAGFGNRRNLHIVTNETNCGFVRTVNRALETNAEGDVLLLNSDTEVFAGAFDELYRVAHSAPEIGTVTALSNNATIFSYPHAQLKREMLSDISWKRLSQIALQKNAGVVIDVPTAHGFCMLIKREVLQRIGRFDESFGRGYGEENDFCARAADFGFRNVASAGVFVYHREGVSFAEDKSALLSKNLATIASRYPEYLPTVTVFEQEDRMRSDRWALDAARLAAAQANGMRFVTNVTNWLEGGTDGAVRDIAEACGAESGQAITLRCRDDGFVQLICEEPLIRATFSASECEALFRMLSAAHPALVVVHQVLGYSSEFVRALTRWIRGYRSVFYVHDHFAICPRVTLIDSSGAFCELPPLEVCDRCIALGGRHEASRFSTVKAEDHRDLMKSLLWRVTAVVAPSANAARYMNRTFPKLPVKVIEHPETGRKFPAAAREGNDREILVLGAIGPHKGSQRLLEIAGLARLRHPELKFRVVGYTDIDEALLALGNVAITGRYDPAALPQLLAECTGRLALFLQQWPETYSYTLSEAVSHGFIPLVPDIGAPADRVRATGFGVVFPFPVKPAEVLSLISDIAMGRRQLFGEGASPALYSRSPEERARLREALGVEAAPPDVQVA